MFTVTFPLIAPAIISGMLLSFIVMLGIYGIPAVLGTPGDIPVLTPTSSSSPTGRRRSTARLPPSPSS
jgi:ABC-type spermidine/putrescine transport system permease subunit I